MEIVEVFGFKPYSGAKMPFFNMSVSAGIPVPVDDKIDKEIDLNDLLIEHPKATFFARISGIDGYNLDISDGDILVVDTAIEAADGRIVVVSVNGSFTIKIYREGRHWPYLEAPDSSVMPLEINEENIGLKPVGVVTKVIHSI